MIQAILLIISNLAWLVFIFMIYKDLRKGLSSPHFDIIVNLMDDKGKIVKSIETNTGAEVKKNEKEVDSQEFESIADISFDRVAASMEKEMKSRKSNKNNK